MTDVLIVDDHQTFGEALELVLGSALAGSAKFARASSVAEGLQCLSEDGPFDLAVVDLMLPDGNGTEVVREIKAQSPATPVAVLSASEDLSGALEAGADEAIPKATNLAEIVVSLRRLAGLTGRTGHHDL